MLHGNRLTASLCLDSLLFNKCLTQHWRLHLKTTGLKNSWIFGGGGGAAPPRLKGSAYSILKCFLVKAHSLFRGPSHIHTCIPVETQGSWGSMPRRSGAACCFYQGVEGEVKNLSPPPPDNYISLGTVSRSDIPLCTTIPRFSGLLTIRAIAGDLVCMLV